MEAGGAGAAIRRDRLCLGADLFLRQSVGLPHRDLDACGHCRRFCRRQFAPSRFLSCASGTKGRRTFNACGGCCGAASSGYPPFFAELASDPAIFDSALGFTPPGDVIGLLYLVNGVLCLFVFEAVRSERVVSVWIPLRHVTILAFVLTAPTLFLHNQVQRVEEQFTLPGWAWLGLAVVVSFAISLLHDWAVDLADGFFNRGLDRIEHQLAEAIRKARNPTEIEHLLADEASRALKLTSAASFRHQGSVLSREGNGTGWDGCGEKLRPETSRCLRLWSMAHPSRSSARRARRSEGSWPSGVRRALGQFGALFCRLALRAARVGHRPRSQRTRHARPPRS